MAWLLFRGLPRPRPRLPEASALWLAPGTPARPLSFAEGAVMLWRLSEWERRAKAWWNACGWTWT